MNFTSPPQQIRQTIMQGEARASDDERILMSTILGSCVSTCMFDPVAKVGGMNHFLLAEPLDQEKKSQFDSSYGLFLMELLINEMIKLGAVKHRMKARLYGGANISSGLGQIGSVNAAFARKFLKDEGIEKVFEDLEGSSARRIEFCPANGRVRSRTVAEAPAIPATTRKPQGTGQAPLGSVELF